MINRQTIPGFDIFKNAARLSQSFIYILDKRIKTMFTVIDREVQHLPNGKYHIFFCAVNKEGDGIIADIYVNTEEEAYEIKECDHKHLAELFNKQNKECNITEFDLDG